MKILFSVPEFDAQLLRVLSSIPSGGADLGECLTAASKIKEGDFDSWYVEWTNLADRIVGEAAGSQARGHSVSAGRAYLRASSYYRAAYFFLAGSPVDPRLVEAYDKHAQAFDNALNLLSYYVERLKIPYGEITLPAYFFKSSPENIKKPTILAFPGYDGTRQETFFTTAKDALDRGFNVLCFDGPGQGELLIKELIYMTSDWASVIGAVIDSLTTHPSVNSEAIALVGVSWGGMLGPIAAAKEHRLAALVASPGQYEALLGIKKALPQVEELLNESNYAVLDQIISQIIADKMVAAKFKHKMWVHGVETMKELLKAWIEYTVVETAAQIECPTLVLDFENESFSKDQAALLFQALRCPKEYILCKNVEGAGEHCAVGALTLVNQRIFDWLEENLKKVPCQTV